MSLRNQIDLEVIQSELAKPFSDSETLVELTPVTLSER